MITEDYVSYEVAKLLKEKGFPFMCNVGSLWVDKQGKTKLHGSFAPITWAIEDDATPCVTQALAMKWLREKGIDICITPEFSVEAEQRVDFFCGYSATVFKTQNGEYIDEYIINKEEETGSAPFGHYEEAVEAALKYCLTELI